MDREVTVISNNIAEFHIIFYANRNKSWLVVGEGLRPRRFDREVEALEFARDQLLILTLENETMINDQ